MSIITAIFFYNAGGIELHPSSENPPTKTAESFMANEIQECTSDNDNNDDVKKETATPMSVNYHFTRRCNYKCGFCFHTAKTSFVLPLEEAKRGLKLLKEAG